MSNVETRQVNRDSLFLLAQVRVDGQDAVTRVKVRNLSAGGMMAEGDSRVVRGSSVQVELRNIGWVDGSVAWKQDNRFGIAFVDEIDPAVVRAPGASTGQTEFESPRYTRNHAAIPPSQLAPDRLRKI
jgi:prepilin-type processing-associated H-X9-DG protein